MTLKEKIFELELAAMKTRLEKLLELGAPRVMSESLSKAIEKADIKIGGDQALLAETFVTVEAKKGNGGKQYLLFNNSIQYFPQAKFGKYICKKA